MSGRRIGREDVRKMIAELERWRDGDLGSKLTWGVLEERFGFSRQAMQSHRDVKVAYDTAKEALRGSGPSTRKLQAATIESLTDNIGTLRALVDDYRIREEEWQRRWQRIAFHLRVKGLDVSEIDKEISGEGSLPSKKEVAKVFSIFDKPLPRPFRQ